MLDFCDKEISTHLLPHAGLTSMHHYHDKKSVPNKGTWCHRVGEWLSQLAGQGGARVGLRGGYEGPVGCGRTAVH